MKPFFILITLVFTSTSLQAQFRVRADGDSNVEPMKDLYIGNFGDINEPKIKLNLSRQPLDCYMSLSRRAVENTQKAF